MEISDDKIKVPTKCEDISVCDDTDDDNPSTRSSVYHKETEDFPCKVRNTTNNIEKFSFKRETSMFDDSRQGLNNLYDCDTDVDNKNNTQQRVKINLRERKRMHDLNLAMEQLREVMPCADGPNMRKLSKIATLSLARNYIQMLTRSIEELKIMLDDAYRSQSVGPTTARRRDIVRVHPFRQYAGIRNVNVSGGVTSNFDSHNSLGFDRPTNIHGGSFISGTNICTGHGCCTGTNRTSIPRGLYNTPWNSSIS